MQNLLKGGEISQCLGGQHQRVAERMPGKPKRLAGLQQLAEMDSGNIIEREVEKGRRKERLIQWRKRQHLFVQQSKL